MKLGKIPSRFWHPYYVLNILLPVSFVMLRLKRLDPGELGSRDMFGFTRESQVYSSLAMMLVVRMLSAATMDSYLSSAFMYARVSVLLLLWFMHAQLCALYLGLWVVIYVVYPQPRFKHPSSIVVLNKVSFDQRITNSSAKTFNVVWFHATWSTRCTEFAPVLATLAEKYHHVRLRFAKVDLSRLPHIAERYNISLAATGVQLPTVICFKQGVEVARIPSIDDVQNTPNKWRRGFTAAHVVHALKLDDCLRQAQRWEEDAKRRHQNGIAARKKR